MTRSWGRKLGEVKTSEGRTLVPRRHVNNRNLNGTIFSVKNILVEGCPFRLGPKHNKGLLVEVQHTTKSSESQFKSVKNWGNQLYMYCERYMGHKWRYCHAGDKEVWLGAPKRRAVVPFVGGEQWQQGVWCVLVEAREGTEAGILEAGPCSAGRGDRCRVQDGDARWTSTNGQERARIRQGENEVVTSGAAEAAQDLRESEEVNNENSSCDSVLETPPRRRSSENTRAGWVIAHIDCSGKKEQHQHAEGGGGRK
ncbi:hypothetical protein DFH08DRAFT_824188 [Mycena albidolilacea]|uniref:Uncharacterized protein n=1 Tax=Mycena albidolilacea TaxID=1033008 RepID=A0AAD6Z4G2_9AGAR|nr:hypothetical protein DFH08DRAFT_824188 [Mycena albidolilacea]